MKKMFLMFALLLSVMITNAQTAIETQKLTDNISIGVFGGVSTPLDFDSMFPINPNLGIKVQKDFTPIFGVQLEGVGILNDNHFSNFKTSVKATNVSFNNVLNISNLIWGYKSRIFEVSTITGLGWFHTWDKSANYLSSKTGVDLSFNLGKGHSFVLTPAVYWNLNKIGHIHFDKAHSQLGINVGYVYHFKNSNGTHSFKVWDISALNNEITYLRQQLAKKPQVVTEYKDKVKVIESIKEVQDRHIIFFVQNSYELTNDAKEELNKIESGTNVVISGFASPEGTSEYNQTLSENRASTVVEYLTQKGVNVLYSVGLGVQGESSGRIVVIDIINN